VVIVISPRDTNCGSVLVYEYEQNIFILQTGSSKTSVIAYQITRCHNPKDLT